MNESRTDSIIREILNSATTRRRAISTGAKVAAAAGIAAVVAGAGGYFGGTLTAPSAPKIDPVFGFSGLTSDAPQPKREDQVVTLMINPRPPIPIPEFFFQPTGLLVRPGQTIKFLFVTPEHTVTAYHPGFGFAQRVPDGVPPFSSPVLPGGAYWLYTFEKEGVYDVFCAPHQILGMVMRIVVGSASGPGATPPPPPSLEEGPPPFPPILTASLVLRDAALSPDNIISKGSVKWEELDPKSKVPLIAPALG
ncbi:MAG: hypothetical protein HYY68_03145 [Thaumarchaeota archaeon]|nr:hypothetical protein [Nitrososphaerota archaeon]MBI3022708.1 hypothetical protein [Nitrososphaerota archaeon]